MRLPRLLVTSALALSMSVLYLQSDVQSVAADGPCSYSTVVMLNDYCTVDRGSYLTACSVGLDYTCGGGGPFVCFGCADGYSSKF